MGWSGEEEDPANYDQLQMIHFDNLSPELARTKLAHIGVAELSENCHQASRNLINLLDV